MLNGIVISGKKGGLYRNRTDYFAISKLPPINTKGGRTPLIVNQNYPMKSQI